MLRGVVFMRWKLNSYGAGNETSFDTRDCRGVKMNGHCESSSFPYLICCVVKDLKAS